MRGWELSIAAWFLFINGLVVLAVTFLVMVRLLIDEVSKHMRFTKNFMKVAIEMHKRGEL